MEGEEASKLFGSRLLTVEVELYLDVSTYIIINEVDEVIKKVNGQYK